jgi:NADP-dependent 3-hydroxy acid dehydrogenase YdfG
MDTKPQNDGLHIVTGATSGIGMAVARTLAARSRRVVALGRNRKALDKLREDGGDRINPVSVDLLDDAAVDAFAAAILRDGNGVSALVHCAGVHFAGEFEQFPVAQLDMMYRSNVRAQYGLTQKLLPALERGRGYLVCINSSAGIASRAGLGAYCATQHAMRALAETWRLELNERGIRVLNIFPGRTFTPRIARLFAQEGRSFRPELLLQPDDIAQLVLLALELPERVELTDVSLRPAQKSY